MKRILLTGMSGTGKSTAIERLVGLGYKAVDLDSEGFCEWDANGDELWLEDRVQRLLATEDTEVLFLAGCAANQVKFYGQFDRIVLLSAPAELMMERLSTRTNNPYGKLPSEAARILEEKDTIEPMLRRGATVEVDTGVPIDQVVEAILGLTRSGPLGRAPSSTSGADSA
jgi:dephospho-CoA kinase